MNLADAIRKATADPNGNPSFGQNTVQSPGQTTGMSETQPRPNRPNPQNTNPQTPHAQTATNPEFDPADIRRAADYAAQHFAVPEPASPFVANGNVVRLELFLSAEQMSGLFRAIMAGQHTVMTAREAAAYLRVSKDTLMKLAEEGEIPGILIDGRWRFPKPNLDEWLSLQRVNQDDSNDNEEQEDVA